MLTIHWGNTMARKKTNKKGDRRVLMLLGISAVLVLGIFVLLD